MTDLPQAENQILRVTNFQGLISTPFKGVINAICWTRTLAGDFSELISKIELTGNITTIEQEDLSKLQLSAQGQLAREILLSDLKLLEAYGAAPVLNMITHYDRDDADSFLSTDVYSFHADRSPIPVDTFLCTYYGDASEIIPNAQAIKKVLIPAIRDELKKMYDGAEEDFEAFLSENSFDLHYQAAHDAKPINLGVGNLWRLATDHPGSLVPPCIHRAPIEESGRKRLLMIC